MNDFYKKTSRVAYFIYQIMDGFSNETCRYKNYLFNNAHNCFRVIKIFDLQWLAQMQVLYIIQNITVLYYYVDCRLYI